MSATFYFYDQTINLLGLTNYAACSEINETFNPMNFLIHSFRLFCLLGSTVDIINDVTHSTIIIAFASFLLIITHLGSCIVWISDQIILKL